MMNNSLWNFSHKIYRKSAILGRITEIMYNVIYGNSISTKANIGCGTVFYHHGLGCVVHEKSVIGSDCRVFGNVTIGCKWSGNLEPGLPPHIGNNVMIGAGAVILGNINIGDYAIVGANIVVLRDVPPKCTVVGNPARIIER